MVDKQRVSIQKVHNLCSDRRRRVVRRSVNLPLHIQDTFPVAEMFPGWPFWRNKIRHTIQLVPHCTIPTQLVKLPIYIRQKLDFFLFVINWEVESRFCSGFNFYFLDWMIFLLALSWKFGNTSLCTLFMSNWITNMCFFIRVDCIVPGVWRIEDLPLHYKIL